MNVEITRVHDDVTTFTQCRHTRTLSNDAVQDGAIALKGVRATNRFKATNQRRIGSVQEQHAHDRLCRHRLDDLLQVLKEVTATNVHHSGNLGQVCSCLIC